MNPKQLSGESVTYQYPDGDWQLQSASFSVMRGEILGIIGPNGAGKSTLLKIAARVLMPKTGRVLIDGKDMAEKGHREIARFLGYLPQNAESRFDYTVQEVVAMGRFPHLKGAGFLSPRDISIVTRCMIQTETKAYRDRPLDRLSGGERQRVLLASVLAQEPKVLLLDEPTSALDIHHQVKFFELLSKLVPGGMGAAVVTHDLNLASLFSDRLLLLKDGRILREGRPEEILTGDVLRETYGKGIEIGKHPTSGRPVIFPATLPAKPKDLKS
jgi:iron complex transport system ATP-binding protein